MNARKRIFPSLRQPIAVLALVVAAALASSRFAVAEQEEDGLATPADCISRSLPSLKVMNYFPSANGWTHMWDNWLPNAIDRDFWTIASLHADTVRVIVNVQSFGFPTPSARMRAELSEVVALAHKHGLKVQLTLFDWYSNYGDIADSKTWASAVVSPYKNDRRIAFIELQNEIDPANSAVIAWTKALIPYVRTAGGNIPVTVSITDGAAGGVGAELPILIAALGTEQPDFYDVHLYYDRPYADFYELALAKAAATGHGRPLLVGETGQSTNSADYAALGIPHTQASYEAFQDYFYRATNHATSALGLPPAAPWILSDFQPNSLGFTGWPPDSDQYNFGLYRADGSAKPAAASVSNFFCGKAVDTSFNNGFEQFEWDPATSLNLPMLWQVYMPNLGNFQIDTTVAHSGSASAEIWNSKSSSSGNPSFFITPIANITAGSLHTATAYVKGKDATGTTQICMVWFAADFRYLNQSCAGSLTGTTSWTKFTLTAKAPANVAWAEIFLTSYDNGGVAWFDDVTFK
jgi:Cellulase (glycosyl hydrolase family 5)